MIFSLVLYKDIIITFIIIIILLLCAVPMSLWCYMSAINTGRSGIKISHDLSHAVSCDVS